MDEKQRARRNVIIMIAVLGAAGAVLTALGQAPAGLALIALAAGDFLILRSRSK